MQMILSEFLYDSRINLSKEELVKIIGTKPATFKSLTEIAFNREMPACWRAAWLMDYLAELEPSLPLPYIQPFWKEVGASHPDGVRRSLLRLLCRYEIPEEAMGMATDLCLDWISKESVPVAIQAYSMEVLLKVARNYPELSDEFIAAIENQVPFGSGGYKARARKVIHELQKLNQTAT